MKCLRCGHCCFYPVAIIVDPKRGVKVDNIRMKDQDERCPHLRGDEPGKYSCAIHHYKWFRRTPCHKHSQIEHGDTPCRMGAYLLSKGTDNGTIYHASVSG